MGLEIEYIDGQTPLSEEEKEDLLIPTITTHKELNEFEQKNIEDALQWILSNKFKLETILSEKFILNIHKRMFSDVWAWAGKFRKSNKNLGDEWWKVPIELRKLIDDTKYWISDKVYSEDEIAIRFKHRLVSIHCFANGNGRHSRLMADILVENVFNQNAFNWGSENLSADGENRKLYLTAIKAADKNDYKQLLNFARS
jgi:Fic-DOC domain mobile mystery protein B